MDARGRGVVAAGHPLTAEAGVQVLREGGNAVDAALGAMLTSFVAEPLLTGLGAGGHMIVADGTTEPALLDFFVAAPDAALDGAAPPSSKPWTSHSATPIRCSTSDPPPAASTGCRQVFVRPRLAGAPFRFAELVTPAARLAREGVALNSSQAYVAKILGDLLRATPESAALWAPQGRILREGEVLETPSSGTRSMRLGREGAEPFYRGDIAERVCRWLAERGGLISPAALAAYEAIVRSPFTCPTATARCSRTLRPPRGASCSPTRSRCWTVRRPPPTLEALVDAMEAAQAERTPEFIEGLGARGLPGALPAHRAWARRRTSRCLTSRDARAGSRRPTARARRWWCRGTGMHLNNVMGEEDLSPLGFHRHPPGGRLPSMMAPSVVVRDGEVELVLGSAGSNRIRSALLQTIVGVVDRGLDAAAAVRAPRIHFEDGVVYHEPGIDVGGLGGRARCASTS